MFGSAVGRAQRLARLWTLRRLYASFGAENSADGRADKLLREWLSPEQRHQYERLGHFEVTGNHTGTRYRISYGSSANVQGLDAAGEPVLGLCFVPAGQLAPGDVMLAQKIALETNELLALARANRFPPCMIARPRQRP